MQQCDAVFDLSSFPLFTPACFCLVLSKRHFKQTDRSLLSIGCLCGSLTTVWQQEDTWRLIRASLIATPPWFISELMPDELTDPPFPGMDGRRSALRLCRWKWDEWREAHTERLTVPKLLWICHTLTHAPQHRKTDEPRAKIKWNEIKWGATSFNKALNSLPFKGGIIYGDSCVCRHSRPIQLL